MDYLIAASLLSISALFSGLTLGLMGLGPYELKRKMQLGNEKAAKIYSVRRKGNLLLVTLLVGNVAANSTLAVFLGAIAPGVVAGLLSTGLITIFAEITPQAVFSHYAMEIGSRLVWLVRFFMFIFYPICAPLAWVLNRTLGNELPTIYSKQELVEILDEHRKSKDSDVRTDEERIAVGALTFGQKKVVDIMTPRSMVTEVEASNILDEKLLTWLVKTGYSRFPVYDGNQDKIVGILYAYKLIGSHNLGKPIHEISDKKVYFLDENANLDHALAAFLKTKHHLFMAINEFSEVTGIVSIEDVIEEIIGKEIVDEFDIYDNVRGIAEKREHARQSLAA